ncbi:PKD domain-containing protein [Nevskia ramosa]|uniref:PKD domain-containing protein n=1 Tax=Nevskia ramosa TaxID=64002 RepID=UPI0003B6778F|nr:lamin tail domain-containing protein [Nevskia ramosa]
MEGNRVKVLVAAAATLFSASSAFAQAAGGVVISQFAVRGPAGGNDEFVEIFNTGSSPIAIGGWTLQGCANGTPGNPSVRATVPGGTSLAAGQFYLFANTAAAGYSLGVAPDATYATGITDLSTTGFSGIRLVPSNSVALSGVAVDGVGSGASPCREGSGIVTPSTTGANTAFLRRLVAGVVQDGNDNATDFPGPAAAGAPRNSATIIGGGGSNLPTVSLAVEPAAFSELGGSAVVTATLSAASTSPVTVNLVFGGAASSGTDYSASSASLSIPAGELSATLTLSAIDDSIFEGDETITATLGTLSNASAGTPNNVTATIVENDQAPPPTVGARIYQIQGAQHRSPMVNMAVSNVPGIVTARAANGFYMQDGDGDGNPATSDGIFVFTSTAPPVAAAVGAQVLVSGTVSEFRPGNDAENLTVTQIGSPTVTPYVGNALFTNTVITPTILGNGGRIPPTDIIDNDSLGNVETSGTSLFDPAQDGLDFDESLEGMLVQVNNARATGPRNSFGEVWVLGDNGSNATGVTARGGVALVERATGIDYNPERIQLDDGLNGITMPAGINTGDSLGTVTGVISYSFDNYELLLTQAPTVTVNPLPPGVRSIQVGGDRLSVGAYNVENLDPNDTSFARLAGQIVNAIGAPDVLALSELQDNNGATNNGTISADQTIALLHDAIVAAGGPSYEAVQINPVNNQDGGEPGGNIRVVQFYNPLRVTFVPGTAGSGGSLDATAPTLAGGKLALTLSPGRVAPTDSAWNASRKPLAVTYDFNGRRVVIINVHFNSKGGDQPLFGVNQPAVLSSEVQRRQQTTLVNSFVDSLQSLDPQARVMVLGDLNDFDFSAPLRILRTGTDGTRDTLRNLGTELVANPAERYSYVFEGNSQELDHILSTPRLLNAGAQYEALHINAEYADQASDHDALLSSFLLPANAAPSAVATAVPATTTGGNLVSLDGTASTDSDGRIATYAWTQTGGPAVSLSGATSATASFTAPSVSSTTLLSFTLQVSDDEGAADSASTSVTVRPPVDTTPLPFSFAAKTDVALGAVVVSDSIVVLGINAPAAITVSGGEYSINNGAFSSLVGAVVNDGDTVRLRQTASNLPATTTTVTLSIDSVSADFKVTTVTSAVDTTPDQFRFVDLSDQASSATVRSERVKITGIAAPAAISISGNPNVMYRINNGPLTREPGLISRNNSILLQAVSGPNAGDVVSATITVGGVSDEWSVTTGLDQTPDSFKFPARSNAQRSAFVASKEITISGLNGPAPISIDAGARSYSINNRPFTGPSTVVNGDRVQMLVAASSAPGGSVTATLTVGTFSAAWTVNSR